MVTQNQAEKKRLRKVLVNLDCVTSTLTQFRLTALLIFFGGGGDKNQKTKETNVHKKTSLPLGTID